MRYAMDTPSLSIGPKLDKTDPFAPVDPGHLWIHGAAPGDYKTAFIINLAYEAAVNQGMNVLVISPEMSYDRLRTLLRCRHAMHPNIGLTEAEAVEFGQLARRGKLTSDMQSTLRDIERDLLTYHRPGRYGRIHTDDRPGVTPANLPERVRQEGSHPGLRAEVVFIDYFPMICRTTKIASQIREMRELTDELGTMVVGTFTVSRPAMNRAQARDQYDTTDITSSLKALDLTDHVSTSLSTPELREKCRVRFQHHKAPVSGLGEPFEMRYVPGVGALLPLE